MVRCFNCAKSSGSNNYTGYWSSGKRLADSATVDRQSFDQRDLPEYMCGGAQRRVRPSNLKRRNILPIAGPSNHTGAQTAKKRKAGSRVTAQGLFKGDGHALDHDLSGNDRTRVGTGFRKQAGSKRAREERAQAAEERLKYLRRSDFDPDVAHEQETDNDRRQAMLDAVDQSDLAILKCSITDFWKETPLPNSSALLSKNQPGQQSRSENNESNCITPDSTAATTASEPKHPIPSSDVTTASASSTSDLRPGTLGSSPDGKPASKKRKGIPVDLKQTTLEQYRGNSALKSAVDRKKLHRALESVSGTYKPTIQNNYQRSGEESTIQSQQEKEWECSVCTLWVDHFQNQTGLSWLIAPLVSQYIRSNVPMHLACAACGTPRRETLWEEES